MDRDSIDLGFGAIGTVCWGICFWWMWRLSKNQNNLLTQLQEQTKRIEKLSQAEHDLIKDLHPQVGEIKDSVDEVIAVVKENTEANTEAIKSGRQ